MENTGYADIAMPKRNPGHGAANPGNELETMVSHRAGSVASNLNSFPNALSGWAIPPPARGAVGIFFRGGGSVGFAQKGQRHQAFSLQPPTMRFALPAISFSDKVRRPCALYPEGPVIRGFGKLITLFTFISHSS